MLQTIERWLEVGFICDADVVQPPASAGNFMRLTPYLNPVSDRSLHERVEKVVGSRNSSPSHQIPTGKATRMRKLQRLEHSRYILILLSSLMDSRIVF